MNRPVQHNHKGFTLLEILIAILIFSIVLTTLFSSFNAFIVSSESVKKDVLQSEQLQILSRRITSDLEAIFILQPPRYKKPQFNSDPDPYRFEGTQTTLGQKTVSSMVFTSLAHTELGADQRTGIARIAYYLKENEYNSYDLYRADALSPFPEDIQSCTDPILCRNISGFDIRYTDYNGEESNVWDSENEDVKYTFPASIDFTITFGSGQKKRISKISIDLAAGRPPIE